MDAKPFEQSAARARLLCDKEADSRPGPVVYWMHRDHRLRDNWGLLLAQQLALSLQSPLAVVHCLSPSFGQAGLRPYAFLTRGLPEIKDGLHRLNIPLVQLYGDPGVEIPKFLARKNVCVLTMDFDPGRIKQAWRRKILNSGLAKIWEVDSRNVVPAWLATDRKEYMARTFRPRLRRLLPEFLEEPAAVQSHPHDSPLQEQCVPPTTPPGWSGLDAGVGEAPGPAPGEKAARRLLNEFLEQRLPLYADHSNDPTRNAVSGLSAHLHFGQISSLRIALEVRRTDAPAEAKDAFLEQLLVRRELAENYVLHEPDHDNLSGAPDWARRTLEDHRHDPREYVYSPEQFEAGATHDELWNAAQAEMINAGRLHGYMRMYWAKKILEWSASPEEALEVAFRLNDRYQLDGRDSNGVAGVMWSIAGVHDQGFKERPVYGKIRYMNAKGAARKFNVKAYIRNQLQDGRI